MQPDQIRAKMAQPWDFKRQVRFLRFVPDCDGGPV